MSTDPPPKRRPGDPGIREQWLEMIDQVLPVLRKEDRDLLMVALVLASFAHADGSIRAVNSTRMAARARLPKRTFERRRAELCHLDLVVQTSRGHGRTGRGKAQTSEWQLQPRATTSEVVARTLGAIRADDMARGTGTEDHDSRSPSRHEGRPSRHQEAPSRHSERETDHPQSFGRPPGSPKDSTPANTNSGHRLPADAGDAALPPWGEGPGFPAWLIELLTNGHDLPQIRRALEDILEQGRGRITTATPWAAA